VAYHFNIVVRFGGAICGRSVNYVQEPLAKGRRGCTGRDLNEKMLATDNRQRTLAVQ
jgi:hypothetical protein